MALRWILLLFLSFPFLLPGSPRQNEKTKDFEMVLGKETQLADFGIKLRIPKDLEPSPIPVLQPRYLKTASGRIAVYSPEELWSHDEYIASWTNPSARVYLARMSRKPPLNLPQKQKRDISLEAYQEYCRSVDPEADGWTEEDILSWIKSFSNADIDSVEFMKNSNGTLEMRYFILKPALGAPVLREEIGFHKEIFIYKNPKNRFQRLALLFYISDNLDSRKSSKVSVASAQSLALMPLKAKTEDKTQEVSRSAAYMAARDKMIQSVKNAPSWHISESEFFIVASNTKSKSDISALAKELERAFASMKELYSLPPECDPVFAVRFFEDHKDLVSYAGNLYQRNAVVWTPGREELLIAYPDWIKDKSRRDEAFDHELYSAFCEQYFYVAAGRAAVFDMWFWFGNVFLFSDLSYKGSRLDFEPPQKKIDELKNIIATANISVASVIKMPYGMENTPAGRAQYRNAHMISWGIVYFLLKNSDSPRANADYKKIIPRYYEALTSGKKKLDANSIAWEGIDMRKFQSDFDAFWKSR